jgi:hypothetical protein
VGGFFYRIGRERERDVYATSMTTPSEPFIPFAHGSLKEGRPYYNTMLHFSSGRGWGQSNEHCLRTRSLINVSRRDMTATRTNKPL